MTVFMDVTGSTSKRPVFNPGSVGYMSSGGIRCSLLTNYTNSAGASSDKDSVVSIKAKELNNPGPIGTTATGMKAFFVATPRPPNLSDQDAQRQMSGLTGTSTTKIQVGLEHAVSVAATGSWYIYIQVKFREVDVQAEYRNATLVATI